MYWYISSMCVVCSPLVLLLIHGLIFAVEFHFVYRTTARTGNEGFHGCKSIHNAEALLIIVCSNMTLFSVYSFLIFSRSLLHIPFSVPFIDVVKIDRKSREFISNFSRLSWSYQRRQIVEGRAPDDDVCLSRCRDALSISPRAFLCRYSSNK